MVIDEHGNLSHCPSDYTAGRAAFHRNSQEKIAGKQKNSQPKWPSLMSALLMDLQLIMDS